MVAVLFMLLIASLLVFVRYGLGWGAVEGAALTAWCLTALLTKPVTWRRGPGWAFAFWAFVMTTLAFAFIALIIGLWLSPWWCLATSLGAGVLITAAIWPAQMRYYRHQRQLLDGQPRMPSRGN